MDQQTPDAYWSVPVADVLVRLNSGADGLTQSEALRRRGALGVNEARRVALPPAIRIFGDQFRNPLLWILFFAVAVSLVVGEWVDAWIILAIVLIGTFLGFFSEYRASQATAKLLSRLALKAAVWRDGSMRSIRASDVVPGDIVLLSAGTLVPADGVLLESKDLYLDEGALTGESFPVEKSPGVSEPDAPLLSQSNAVFMGTSVRSGNGRMVAAGTGASTHFGKISERLRLHSSETDFERGLRQFGGLLAAAMTGFVLVIFGVNAAMKKPLLDSLLFSIALAVGLSPELLPAILAATLSRGAQRMAREGVIVRRLNAMENLGGMTILCSDKTGTLTVGRMELVRSVDAEGRDSEDVLRQAFLTSLFQTGMRNPIDDSILEASRARGLSSGEAKKVDEVPYDFIRRRMTIVVEERGRRELLTKGAVHEVLEICGSARGGVLDRDSVLSRVDDWAGQGNRVLAIAGHKVEAQSSYTRSDETGLELRGFLLFRDPPHPDAGRAIQDLEKACVRFKLVTGDHAGVAVAVARAVGARADHVLTGREISELRDDALRHRAERADIFAEVDPEQKERIILALRKRGHSVGFLGDGINDAPALHSADVGISVESAADVAREAADVVLVRHDLGVLARGIRDGRTTFSNTLKYLYITTSANFGNMVSMAVASIFLPFLPLTATQILLNNFLSDLPQFSIGGDRVDPDWTARPRRWRIAQIRNFMLGFGVLSSVFDGVTFLVLLRFFHADEATFRTGWFVESLLTELGIIFVVRTRGLFLMSRPSPVLAISGVAVMILALSVPYLAPGHWFGFVPLEPGLLSALVVITLAYLVVAEILKPRFLGRRP
jgi:Mg2+-importing ATPase